ncbi:MAG TPA: aminotransferase class III-fold pyridoxal phosphate-dependent enzyme [Candidatus Dormibacteraeota bacterium]
MTAVLPDRWLNELSRAARDLRLVRGDGPYVWDDEDRRYLDLTSNGGTTLLGHNDARINDAISAQLGTFTAVPPGFDYDLREELLEALSFIIPTPLTHVSFTASGSEAVDLAITWVAAASERPRLIAMQRSDHGTGIGGRAASMGDRVSPIAGRMLEVVRVPFGSIEALEAQLDDGVAAVIVEPVQVEAGVRIPPEGYLADVGALCRQVGALLVVDEVRTALRMGPTLASAAADVAPDIVCLGSSLANGMPFGVTAVGPTIARQARIAGRELEASCPPLVSAAANATIRTVLGPTLRAMAGLTSDRLQSRLRALRLGEIREVRGCGSMVAVETSLNAAMLLRHLQRRDVLALPGGPGCVRFMAPLILDRREADFVVETLAAVILASRPPRRRSAAAPDDAVDVELPGRAARPRALRRAGN